MPDIQHANITGAELHEPKGVAGASANTVYVANGSGSGTWQQVTASQIDSTTINNLNKVVLNVHHDDLSASSSHYVVAPIAGTITEIYSVIDSAIAHADTVLSFEIGGVAVTNGNITITQSGSAAGDVDSSTPTGNNTVSAGQAIEVISDGGTTTSNAHAHLTIVIDVS
jgi:hypothetical protein